MFLFIKQDFNKNQQRGCLDYFLAAQRDELDEQGRPTLTDEEIRGLLMNFVVGGKIHVTRVDVNFIFNV